MVIKRDGSRVAFDGERVLAGIQQACSKRPIEAAVMERIATQVEDELHRRFQREVESAQIGRAVALRLREVDPVAYIRYASVYYAFRSVEDFAAEITALQERPPVGDHPSLFGEGRPKA
jgi:transcriptional repressor NrdR